jgi:hypothetical protein
VQKFAKSKGTKAYVGFIRPIIDSDKEFGLEMVCSENRQVRRRLMPSELSEVVSEEEMAEEEEAEVPKLW